MRRQVQRRRDVVSSCTYACRAPHVLVCLNGIGVNGTLWYNVAHGMFKAMSSICL